MEDQAASILTSLVVGLCSVSAAGIVAYFNYKSNMAKKCKENLLRAYQQIEAYYTVEQLLCEQVAELSPDDGAVKTIKSNFRNQAEEKVGVRPVMTATEVRRYQQAMS